MAQFFLSKAASEDLVEIWDYIAQDSLDIADRVVQQLENKIKVLSKNPQMGHRRPDLTHHPVRFWPVYQYLIIYLENKTPLHVVRILGGYRDIARLLKANH